MPDNVKFFYPIIMREIGKDKKTLRLINKLEKAQFDIEKKVMLAEFDSHDVTREISGGPDAQNITQTLQIANEDQGNLFSFIGFEAGDNPISKLRAVLKEHTNFFKSNQITVQGNVFKGNARATFPSRSDIQSQTPYPWLKGRSWALDIESEIPGISAYLFKRGRQLSGSYSGPAIQVKGKQAAGLAAARNAVFQGIDYLSEIFGNFVRRFGKGKPVTQSLIPDTRSLR